MAHEAENVKYEEEFIHNKSGTKLFTCRWLPPKHHEPKALIFLCHGYAVECSIFMADTGVRLAKAGYGVYGIDYIGHGKSEGLQAYVPDFDQLVDDVCDHYTQVSERAENKKKLRFLYGESMGGAVALLLNRKKPTYWDGAVLVAPMCKIADELKPPQIVIRILTALSKVGPTWKLTPIKDITDVAFKDPKKKEEIKSSPFYYQGKPRLRTSYELYRVTVDLEKKLNEVTLPFLIVHGEADVVTDPAVSKELFESASSTDKTLKLYPEMWHALTIGEPPESIDLVFSDIVSWLDKRVSHGNSRLESERKSEHDAVVS